MQTFVNQPFLKKRATWARWGSYLGLGALVVGLFTSGRSPLLAYAFLLVGLLGATVGSYLANTYVREPRADQTLANVLDGLDKRFALYSYYLPCNHVIVSHHGLLAVLPKQQGGQVSYELGRWRHKSGWRKVFQLFGEPNLGKPDQDLPHEIRAVKDWIDQIMPEKDIPVDGVVVFTNADVQLSLSDVPVPAMAVANLAEYLKRGIKGQPTLSTALQTELRKVLDEVVGAN